MDATRVTHEVGTVACDLTVKIAAPTSLVLQVALARRPGLGLDEQLDVTDGSVPAPVREIVSVDGGRQHLIEVAPCTLTIGYRATVTRTDRPAPEQVTDEQRVTALRPSRYCPSDRLAGFARNLFGDLPDPAQQVQAICDYVWTQIRYEAAASGPTTDAVDTLLSGRGVCRDFAHLVSALCRAVDVPTRTAAVYAPGLSPMDFHVVAETAIDGAWHVWDATRLAPRATLMRIATGRDAADTAIMTVISGRAELCDLAVTAVSARDLPADGHLLPAGLA